MFFQKMRDWGMHTTSTVPSDPFPDEFRYRSYFQSHWAVLHMHFIDVISLSINPNISVLQMFEENLLEIFLPHIGNINLPSIDYELQTSIVRVTVNCDTRKIIQSATIVLVCYAEVEAFRKSFGWVKESYWKQLCPFIWCDRWLCMS